MSKNVSPCDGTYCRSVHIVVGDNMYRPSLHILSSIGTYCRRQKSPIPEVNNGIRIDMTFTFLIMSF